MIAIHNNSKAVIQQCVLCYGNRLSKSYEILIIKHFEACDDNTFSQLWKSCFYKQIEDFRQAMKRFKAAADAAVDRSVRSSEAHNFKQLLAAAQEMFNDFLTNSKQYFQKLMKKVLYTLLE